MSVNKSLTFISHNCDRRTSRINKLSEYNYLSYISQTNLDRWTERNHREREIVKRRYWVLENLQGISCRKTKGPSHQSNRLHRSFKSFNGWQNEDQEFQAHIRASCKIVWQGRLQRFSGQHEVGIQQIQFNPRRSIMNLHDGWNSSFRFAPIQDNIEQFVRDFQETATQFNYVDEAIANMIESCMPIEK